MLRVSTRLSGFIRPGLVRQVTMCLFAFAAVSVPGFAGAQNYPTRPIRVITGGAGGSSDFVARIIGDGIAGPLGQPIVVENRAPAVAPGEVAKAAPDGYTIHVTGTVALIAPLLGPVSYDPIKDFVPITIAVRSPLVLVVNPSLPVHSVRDLITYAKTKPGELNYGSVGIGGSAHLSTELLKSMAKVNMVHIPYKLAPQALADTISGKLQVLFSNDDALKGELAAGRLRALAVSSLQRSALFPDLPTIAEAGVPGYDSQSIQGFWGPAGIPAPIINRLNQEIVRVLRQPDVKEKFLKIGTEVVASSPEEFAMLIRTEISKWSAVIKDAGIKGEGG